MSRAALTSHVDLVAMARRVRGAVERDDVEGLHAELTRLRTAVMDHLLAERAQLGALPDPAAAVVREGQWRLLRSLTRTLFEPGDRDGGDDCNCLVRAAEIELAIRRQARLETALLRRHPSTARTMDPTAGGRR